MTDLTPTSALRTLWHHCRRKRCVVGD